MNLTMSQNCRFSNSCRCCQPCSQSISKSPILWLFTKLFDQCLQLVLVFNLVMKPVNFVGEMLVLRMIQMLAWFAERGRKTCYCQISPSGKKMSLPSFESVRKTLSIRKTSISWVLHPGVPENYDATKLAQEAKDVNNCWHSTVKSPFSKMSSQSSLG